MEPPLAQPANLTLDTKVVKKILVDFIRDGVHRSGFKKGVLGLSGGVDSSVAAYLAVEALGKENLLGLILPHQMSSSQSRVDAELVANAIGITTEVVDITPMVEAHVRNGDVDRVRKGNIMARERMIVLYDASSRIRALVIGTSNKTESLLGYGTLFGDTACALNPLGDLYKTQVWQLARELGVPSRIIEKLPSADLWAGQSDEQELGFTYKEVDTLLFHLIDERKTAEELVDIGFAREFITSVQTLVEKSQFKRRPPIVAKISHRTTNIDFRYPRDWGI
jgi:NAD+ synthase